MQRLAAAPAPARLRVGDAESASPRELGSQGQTVGLAGRQARPSGTASVSRSVGPILLILSYESELLIYFWAKIQGSPEPTWTTLWARHWNEQVMSLFGLRNRKTSLFINISSLLST